jgi:hypothetical protein
MTRTPRRNLDRHAVYILAAYFVRASLAPDDTKTLIGQP